MSTSYKIGVYLVGEVDTLGVILLYFRSPDSWGATFFLFEYAIEIGTGGEATFGRNDVITIVWICLIYNECACKITIIIYRYE